jgi:hypothetical protein
MLALGRLNARHLTLEAYRRSGLLSAICGTWMRIRNQTSPMRRLDLMFANQNCLLVAPTTAPPRTMMS